MIMCMIVVHDQHYSESECWISPDAQLINQGMWVVDVFLFVWHVWQLCGLLDGECIDPCKVMRDAPYGRITWKNSL